MGHPLRVSEGLVTGFDPELGDLGWVQEVRLCP